MSGGYPIGRDAHFFLATAGYDAAFGGVDLIARDLAELEILTLEERLAGIKAKVASDRARADAGVPRNRAQRRKAASQARRRK